ncbi:hypothetical protein TELCIR_26250 [Teladorsagia circumcincta]|uniref:Uncharacterized protein n=1 Tax=Teladorsagia circumcincta TaxID=45464 RepID=A0A2G9T3C6_TELCI|nr:hypothetical protein TELCIR_26250 [Teladorsagia circumcincta]
MVVPNKIKPAMEPPGAIHQETLPRKKPRKRKSNVVGYLESAVSWFIVVLH